MTILKNRNSKKKQQQSTQESLSITQCAARELRMNLSQFQPQVVSFSHVHPGELYC